jgi:hypothetical protein
MLEPNPKDAIYKILEGLNKQFLKTPKRGINKKQSLARCPTGKTGLTATARLRWTYAHFLLVCESIVNEVIILCQAFLN